MLVDRYGPALGYDARRASSSARAAGKRARPETPRAPFSRDGRLVPAGAGRGTGAPSTRFPARARRPGSGSSSREAGGSSSRRRSASRSSDGSRLELFGRRHGFGDGILGEILEDAEGNLWIGTQSTGLLRVRPTGFTSFGEEDGLVDAQVAAVFRGRGGALYVASRGNTALARREGDGFRSVRWPRAAAPVLGRLIWGRSVLRDRSGRLVGRVARRSPPAGRRSTSGTRSRGRRRARTGRPKACRERSPRSSRPRTGRSGRVCTTPPTRSCRFDAGGRSLRRGERAGRPAARRAARLPRGREGRALDRLRHRRRRAAEGRARRPARPRRAGRRKGSSTTSSSTAPDVSGSRTATSGLLRVDDPAAERLAAHPVPVQSGAVEGSALCLARDAAGLHLGRDDARRRASRPLDGAPGAFHDGRRPREQPRHVGRPRRRRRALVRDPRGRLAPRPGAGSAARAPPRAVIAAFRVNGNARPVPELGTAALTGIALAPDENRIRVDFASPSFTPGGRALFQTRLEGLDTQWSPPTPDPTVRYVGLAPGAYRLAVRALSPDGAPGPEATAAFRLRAPFWRRAEFLLSVARARRARRPSRAPAGRPARRRGRAREDAPRDGPARRRRVEPRAHLDPVRGRAAGPRRRERGGAPVRGDRRDVARRHRRARGRDLVHRPAPRRPPEPRGPPPPLRDGPSRGPRDRLPHRGPRRRRGRRPSRRAAAPPLPPPQGSRHERGAPLGGAARDDRVPPRGTRAVRRGRGRRSGVRRLRARPARGPGARPREHALARRGPRGNARDRLVARRGDAPRRRGPSAAVRDGRPRGHEHALAPSPDPDARSEGRERRARSRTHPRRRRRGRSRPEGEPAPPDRGHARVRVGRRLSLRRGGPPAPRRLRGRPARRPPHGHPPPGHARAPRRCATCARRTPTSPSSC